MSTPHNSAQPGDIAKIVLMPGDPLRARFVAGTYLTDVVQFNNLRGMAGFTGYYKGNRVSVMGSGMGCGSIGIYSYELYKFYDVEAIIRIGSAGAMKEPAELYDVVLAKDSFSESTYAKVMCGNRKKILKPDKQLNRQLAEAAQKLGLVLLEGRVNSSDVFYQQQTVYLDKARDKYNCLITEMETFTLFANAELLGKRAAALLTVSDMMYGSMQETSAEERQNSFTRMMEIALEVTGYYQ